MPAARRPQTRLAEGDGLGSSWAHVEAGDGYTEEQDGVYVVVGVAVVVAVAEQDEPLGPRYVQQPLSQT